MQRSTLNADLYCNNIINSPWWQCGGFENAQHLFFSCPLYTDSRSNLSIHILHYSTSIPNILPLQENKTLFIAVQQLVVAGSISVCSSFKSELTKLNGYLPVTVCQSNILSLSLSLSPPLSLSLPLVTI